MCSHDKGYGGNRIGSQIIRTLMDRSQGPRFPVLPEELRTAYGGDLRFPASLPDGLR
jgi:hypothetical protein